MLTHSPLQKNVSWMGTTSPAPRVTPNHAGRFSLPCPPPSSSGQKKGKGSELRSAEPLTADKQDSSGSGSVKTPVSQHWQEEWGCGDEKLYSPAVLQAAVCPACVSAAAGSDTQLISRLMYHCSHF